MPLQGMEPTMPCAFVKLSVTLYQHDEPQHRHFSARGSKLAAEHDETRAPPQYSVRNVEHRIPDKPESQPATCGPE